MYENLIEFAAFIAIVIVFSIIIKWAFKEDTHKSFYMRNHENES
jgi:hypothetical protein